MIIKIKGDDKISESCDAINKNFRELDERLKKMEEKELKRKIRDRVGL